MRILKYLVILSTIFASSISSAGTLVVNSNQSGESSEAAFNAYVAAFEAAHPDIDVQVNLTEHEVCWQQNEILCRPRPVHGRQRCLG